MAKRKHEDGGDDLNSSTSGSTDWGQISAFMRNGVSNTISSMLCALGASNTSKVPVLALGGSSANTTTTQRTTPLSPVHFTNATNVRDFISLGAKNRSKGLGQPLAWLFDREGAVGLMVCGNWMRPGGATFNPQGEFSLMLYAKTQEEAALSFLASLNQHWLNQVICGLTDAMGSMASAPKGDETDFNVKLPDGTSVNIQKAVPEFYRREIYRFWAGPTDGRGVFVCAVGGPNAKCPQEPWPKPRPSQDGKPDTVYRTTSAPCIHNYHVFKKSVANAVEAFLVSAHEQRVKRVIIAPVSCGLYAGNHKDRIRSEFHEICLQALHEVETSHGACFGGVLIPRFY